MKTVLIADDEKKVCQLVANLIDWESLGFEIVGVVNDGISAYKFIQENTVNLMITDIRMPECDGMELIQKAKVLYPNLHIVIISGYSQFDYAQNAIRYGVEDYLLKPIRKKDLMATLQKILDRYKEEVLDAKKWQDIQKKLEENEEIVKRSLLEDLLKRPEKFGGFFICEKINAEYHYKFAEDCYQALIVKIFSEKRKEDTDTRRILLQKGMELLKESVHNVCNEVVFNIIDGEIYGLFNGTEEELHKIYRRLKKVKLDVVRLQDVYDMDQGKRGQELCSGLIVKEFDLKKNEADCIMVLNAAHIRSVYGILKGEHITLFDMNTYLTLPFGIEECLIDCKNDRL